MVVKCLSRSSSSIIREESSIIIYKNFIEWISIFSFWNQHDIFCLACKTVEAKFHQQSQHSWEIHRMFESGVLSIFFCQHHTITHTGLEIVDCMNNLLYVHYCCAIPSGKYISEISCRQSASFFAKHLQVHHELESNGL